MPADLAAIGRIYAAMEERHRWARERLGRGLTLAEKILAGHLDAAGGEFPSRRESYADLRPDRVAMQDATAQMAILQFMQAGLDRVSVPTTVHCDHLIQARLGAREDLSSAEEVNDEVYRFLLSASQRYGIGFWKPGAGIIHQVVLENYAFPGGMMIGTDSHTPNAGGLGMVAIGVGGADAVDVMAGLPWNVRWPGVIGVRLDGELKGWASAKDVILKVAGTLTVKGGTGAIVEYFGPGARTISSTGKATITNMGAELGATCSVFPFDDEMARYLCATGREEVAALAAEHAAALVADPQVEEDPASFYDRVVKIDLSTLEPHIVGPHSPDRARPISRLAKEVASEGWPDEISAALIGSCTNSSYQDLERAAEVARGALAHGLGVATPFLISPGSTQVYRTVERDGQAQAFEDLGGTVLANACGPCIGQWHREGLPAGEANSILCSFNRNFPGRNDGNPETLSFIGSPEIVTALAVAGRLSFNPLTDTLVGVDGAEFRLEPPGGKALPEEGFVHDATGYVEPPEDGSAVEVEVAPGSERLQLLQAFEAWGEGDFASLPILLKARGKCTTDHISPAGKWLRFRGHLENISQNMFEGAINAFSGERGSGSDTLAGATGRPFHEIAARYKKDGLGWIVVGDENYGEGSSREHAAMSPRFLGCRAVIARSFARIHETNLKKQGLLPLRFANGADYDKVREGDRVTILGLESLAPGRPLQVVFTHTDGSTDRAEVNHTLSEEQIRWHRAGAALNTLRKERQGGR
ncbi:MAG: aconitate hydratase [Planctomycetota bacterium]